MKTIVITELAYEIFEDCREVIEVLDKRTNGLLYSPHLSYTEAYTVHKVTSTTYVIPGYGKIRVGYTPDVEAALKAIFEIKERTISEQYKGRYDKEIARLKSDLASKDITIISLRSHGKICKFINKLLGKEKLV